MIAVCWLIRERTISEVGQRVSNLLRFPSLENLTNHLFEYELDPPSSVTVSQNKPFLP